MEINEHLGLVWVQEGRVGGMFSEKYCTLMYFLLNSTMCVSHGSIKGNLDAALETSFL